MKKQKSSIFAKKFEDKSPNDKNYCKVILVNTDVRHIAYVI